MKIEVESFYDAGRRQPLVLVTWDGRLMELTPAEAQVHAINVLNAASDAETIRYAIEFFEKELGISLREACGMLAKLNKFRQAVQ